MEGLKSVDEQMETSYNREQVAEHAAVEAKRMISEQIVAEDPAERFIEMTNLMQELAEDNENRFIVEAIAQQLSLEKARAELAHLEDLYPLAA